MSWLQLKNLFNRDFSKFKSIKEDALKKVSYSRETSESDLSLEKSQPISENDPSTPSDPSVSRYDLIENIIFGDSKDNTFEAGFGIDIIHGGFGNDTYIWNLGDGNDVIHENAYGGSDTISFRNILSSDVTFVQDDNDLIIQVQGNEEITVVDHFDGQFQQGIEFFEFQDTTLDYNDILV